MYKTTTKVQKLLSLLLIMVLTLIPMSAFANSVGTTATVKKDYVALRKDPGVPVVKNEKNKDKATIEKEKNANIIGSLSKGDKVTILKTVDKNGWTQVKVDSKAKKVAVRNEIGYVDNAMLEFKGGTTQTTTQNSTVETVTVKKSTNFLDYSGKEGNLYYKLGAGNSLKYLGTTKNGWAKLQNNAGTIGYADARCINIKKPFTIDMPKKTTSSTNSTSNTSSSSNTSTTVKNAVGKYVNISVANNFLHKADRSSNIYYKLGVGNTVKYLGTEKNGLAKIQNLAGTIGYCESKYIDFSNPTSSIVSSKPANKGPVKKEDCNVLISKFNTFIQPAKDGRRVNVSLSAGRINGTLLMPGQVFDTKSLIANKNGKITADDGYQPAPSFIGGAVKDSVGGGVCQTATTVYNAALLANLEIIEGLAHSMKVSYVKPGLDASYATGYKNPRFRNNKAYPILVKMYLIGNTLTSEIWSTHDVNYGKKYSTRVEPESSNVYYTYLDEKDSTGKVIGTKFVRKSVYTK